MDKVHLSSQPPPSEGMERDLKHHRHPIPLNMVMILYLGVEMNAIQRMRVSIGSMRCRHDGVARPFS